MKSSKQKINIKRGSRKNPKLREKGHGTCCLLSFNGPPWAEQTTTAKQQLFNASGHLVNPIYPPLSLPTFSHLPHSWPLLRANKDFSASAT